MRGGSFVNYYMVSFVSSTHSLHSHSAILQLSLMNRVPVLTACDSIMEEQTLGELLEALSLQPVMTMMLRLMNMVRDSACFSNHHVSNEIKNDSENFSIT